MKRRVSFIVIGLASVLIPTFIMLSFYLSNRNIPVEIRNAEEVILLTPDEKTVKAVSNGENDDLYHLSAKNIHPRVLPARSPKTAYSLYTASSRRRRHPTE